MNSMQVTPVDPNPANNSIYKDVLALKDFLATLYIPVEVCVTNYQMGGQVDLYNSYYLDTTPDTIGNFMIRGNVGNMNINVARFKKNLTGFSSNIERLRYVHSTLVGSEDFYSWLLNFDWLREAVDHLLGVRLSTVK